MKFNNKPLDLEVCRTWVALEGVGWEEADGADTQKGRSREGAGKPCDPWRERLAACRQEGVHWGEWLVRK